MFLLPSVNQLLLAATGQVLILRVIPVLPLMHLPGVGLGGGGGEGVLPGGEGNMHLIATA